MKTIQELILAVQDRISLPLDDDDRWNTAALVTAFNAALDDRLTPDLVSEGSNYLVQREVFPLRVNNVTAYPLNAIPIPSRAVGRVLREVKYIPQGSSGLDGEVNCLMISLEDKDKYLKDPAFYGSTVPYVFIENDSLRFIGGDGLGSIVMYYNLEPSTLENVVGKYATITAWGSSSLTATGGSAQWDTFIPNYQGKTVDIYRKSTGMIIKANVAIGRSGTTYFVNNLTTTEIQQIQSYQSGNIPGVGFATTTDAADLLMIPSGKCEFATIPSEYDQLLVLYVCERVLEALGDTEGLQVVMAKVKETRESISRLSQNRMQGEKRILEDRRSVSNVQPRSIQELILDVYDKIRVPLDEDPRWTTPAIVRAFNAAMVDKLAPDLVAEGTNYLIHRDVLPLTSNGTPVYPLNSIPLPRRAIGRALREVKYLPAGKTKMEEELNCPAISLEEKDMFAESNDLFTAEAPYVFIENDNLRLVGGKMDGSIVMYYSLEPSKLTATSGRYAKVQRWTGTSGGGLMIENAPSGGSVWDSYISYGATKIVDIFCKSTGAILKTNVKVTRGASSDTYTIAGLTLDEIKQIKSNQTGGFPTNADIVDYPPELYLVPAGECEFVTIPEEFDQLLVLYVCERIVESLGDTQGLQVILAKIQMTRDSISRVTGNRLQGERRKLTDRRSIARIQRGHKWTRNYNKNYT